MGKQEKKVKAQESPIKIKIKNLSPDAVIAGHYEAITVDGSEFPRGTQVIINKRHEGDPSFYHCRAKTGTRNANIHIDNLAFVPSSKQELEYIQQSLTEHLSMVNVIMEYGSKTEDYVVTDGGWKIEMIMNVSTREDLDEEAKRKQIAEIMLLEATDLIRFNL